MDKAQIAQLKDRHVKAVMECLAPLYVSLTDEARSMVGDFVGSCIESGLGTIGGSERISTGSNNLSATGK